MTSPTPTLSYHEGQSLPNAVIGCAGGGLMSAYTSIVVVIAELSPGGSLRLTVPDGQILNRNVDSIEVNWSPADIGSLPPGEYGATVVATKSGEEAKWTGLLAIEPAN